MTHTPPLVDLKTLQTAVNQHIQAYPEERTFKLEFEDDQVIWVKRPSPARLSWLYRLNNGLVATLGMPYFQAPPHKGGPGGTASLKIEQQMLARLNAAGVYVPTVVASDEQWLAMTSTGTKNLDMRLKELPLEERYPLWQQAVTTILDVHQKKQCLSQCFARNINLSKQWLSPIPIYTLSFLDFEEDPTQVMSLAQAQARDWMLFLHSTAVLLQEKQPDGVLFFRNTIQEESPETQKALQVIFTKLKMCKMARFFLWLGQDAKRVYELGRFADQLLKKLRP